MDRQNVCEMARQTTANEAVLSLLKRPPEVDFQQALRDLKVEGSLTLQCIANSVNMPWSTIQRYLDGTQPGYENGRAIVLFYQEVLHRFPPNKPMVTFRSSMMVANESS